MQRVFAVIGFSLFFVFLILSNFSIDIGFYTFLISLFLGALSLVFKRTRKSAVIPLLLLTICFGSGYLSLRRTTEVMPAESLAGETAKVSAVLVDLPKEQDGYTQYIFKTEKIEIENAPQNIKVMVSSNEPFDMDTYDRIEGTMQFYSKNSKNSYAQGIYAFARIENPVCTKMENKPIYNWFLNIRKSLISAVESGVGVREAALTGGILVGDTSKMSTEDISNFRLCGLSHVVSVSGMHISIFTGIVFSILMFFGVRKRVSSLIGIAVILFYMALTGFSFPVVRAGIMGILLFGGVLFGRTKDSINSLGFSAAVVLLYNPYAALNVGFLLSFLATLGLCVVTPIVFRKLKAYRFRGRLSRKICELAIMPLIQTLSATLFTLPVIFFVFGYVSVVSPIVNVLIAPLVPINMMSGALMGLCSGIGFLKAVFGFLIQISASAMLGIAEFFAGIPFVTLPLDEMYVGLWTAAVLLLCALAVFLFTRGEIKGKMRLARVTALLSSIVLLVSTFSALMMTDGFTTLTVFDSGKGACILVESSGYNLLIGAGGDSADYALSRYAARKGITKLDLVILPSDENVFSKSAANSIRKFQADKVLMNPAGDRYYEVAALIDPGDIYPYENSQISIGDLKIKPVETISGSALLICVGDTSFAVCDKSVALPLLPPEFTNADLVLFADKAPELLDTTPLKQAVVCSNEKTATDSIKRLSAAGIQTYATAGKGNLQISTYGNGDFVIRRKP